MATFHLGIPSIRPQHPTVSLGILTGHDKKFLPERTLSRCKPQWLQPRYNCHTNKIPKLLDALSSEKKKGAKKIYRIQRETDSITKKKSETKEQKKNLVFMQQYLKIGLLSLELFTSQKKTLFFPKGKAPEHWEPRTHKPKKTSRVNSLSTFCHHHLQKRQPFEGGLGRKIPRTPTWDD